MIQKVKDFLKKFWKPILWVIAIFLFFVICVFIYFQIGNKIKNSLFGEKTPNQVKSVPVEKKEVSPVPTKQVEVSEKKDGSNLPYIFMFIVVFPFFGYACAKKNVLFTFVESGNIKFVMRGNSLHRIIHDVKGYELRNNTFVWISNTYDQRSRFNKVFGIWWTGIPPFSKILWFDIKKQREDKTASKVSDWVSKPEITSVDSLRFRFPRPYVLTDVELKDRLSVNLLVVAIFEVVNPYTPVILLKGDFFDITGANLESEIIDLVKELGIDSFIGAEKGSVDGLLARLKKDYVGPDKIDINSELIKQVGLELVGISINKYDPSDTDIVAAIQEAAKARATGEAKVVQAEKDREKKLIDADAYSRSLAITNAADVQAQTNLARARREQIKATLESLSSPGVNPNVVAKAAADIHRTEAVAGEKSKITTWVDGGGAVPTVPVRGENK